jgi:hypothetical protein
MVTFAGQEIPRSPFDVNVGPYKQTMIRAYGPGLTSGVVGYPALFTVETNGETGALGMHHFIPSVVLRMRCVERYFNFILSYMGLYVCVKVKFIYSLSLFLCACKESSVRYSVE